MSRLRLKKRPVGPPSPPPVSPPPAPPPSAGLTASAQVSSTSNGQIIELLDITSTNTSPGVSILHSNVTVRNCRITMPHGGHGVRAISVVSPFISGVETINSHAPAAGAETVEAIGVVLDTCTGTARVDRLTARDTSTAIYAVDSPGCLFTNIEGHDMRGPFPKGQLVQFNRSPNSTLNGFSCENTSDSWPEDNISVYESSGTTVRNGYINGNNSNSGVGVMVERCSNCLVEDVDTIGMGNGAFSAVSSGILTQNNTFRRCRTRDSLNISQQGRGVPLSNSLSYGSYGNEIGTNHYDDCAIYNLANPGNVIYDASTMNYGVYEVTFPTENFTPRAPIRNLLFQSPAAGNVLTDTGDKLTDVADYLTD